MLIKNEEATTIVGGASFTAAMLSALTSLLKFVYNVGQNLGSSIRKGC